MPYKFPSTNKIIAEKYLELDQGSDVQVMYIWIDGTGELLRGKTKTMKKEPKDPKECPIWNYDGSSTGQAKGHDSDVYLYPARLYPDPFRGGKNKLLLCEVYDNKKRPVATNHRQSCKKIMEMAKSQQPLFLMKQEFTLLDRDKHPWCWPKNGYPAPQGPYYCGLGANFAYGRDVVDSAYRACLYAGVCVTGTNADIMPAQWTISVGPSSGVNLGDDLWMTRYIMSRVGEDYGIIVSFDPKPEEGEWHGAGNYVSFSTEAMREQNGLQEINNGIEKMSKRVLTHIKNYDPHGGEDNKRRLTGKFGATRWDEFSVGIGLSKKDCSIRIPSHVREQGYGYFQDRRPSSNSDPYQVTEIMSRTICLSETDDELVEL